MIKSKIKSLASDTVTYGLFQAFGRLLTFLLTPLYSNYLTPVDNGVIAYIFSLLVIVQFIYVLGMEATYFRFYNKEKDILGKKVFTTSFLVVAVVSIFFTALLLLFSTSISSVIIDKDYPNGLYIFQIACLIPLFDGLIVMPYAKLRMEHKVKQFAITRFLLIFLGVVLNVFFITNTKFGAIGVFLGLLISSIVGCCIFLPQIVKMMDFHFDWQLIKDMLKFGLPTLPANVSSIALQIADRPIMKLFVSDADIGIYQINAKLAVPMLLFVTVFDYAWKPFFLTHYKDEDAKILFSRVLTYYVLLASVLWILISLFISYIVRIPLWNGRFFIHPDYWDGVGIVPIIIVGYLINGIIINFAAVFHIEKKTQYLPIAIGVAALSSIALNFVLLPIIGTIGAAISLSIGYFVGAILMHFLQKKVNYQIHYEWKRISILMVASISTVIVGQIITNNLSLLPSFFMKLGLIILYVISLRIFGFFSNGELKEIKKIFKNK